MLYSWFSGLIKQQSVVGTLSNNINTFPYIIDFTMDSIVPIFAVILTIFWYFSSFPANYYHALKTGLPIFLCPVNPANPVWLVFAATFQPLLAKYLPSAVYNRIKTAIFG